MVHYQSVEQLSNRSHPLRKIQNSGESTGLIATKNLWHRHNYSAILDIIRQIPMIKWLLTVKKPRDKMKHITSKMTPQKESHTWCCTVSDYTNWARL